MERWTSLVTIRDAGRDSLVTSRFGHLDRTNKGCLFLLISEADHMAPWMKACISSGVSLPSLLLSIPLKIRS